MVSAVVGNENAGFWKRLPERRFLKMLAYKEVLKYDDARRTSSRSLARFAT